MKKSRSSKRCSKFPKFAGSITPYRGSSFPTEAYIEHKDNPFKVSPVGKTTEQVIEEEVRRLKGEREEG